MPDSHPPEIAAFRTRVADALAAAPSVASYPGLGRAVWRSLGGSGVLAELFQPEYGDTPSPARLDAVLTALDARYPIGVVLSICVQMATALPVLRAASDGEVTRKAYEAAIAGEAVLALAATDSAAAGSDLMGLGTSVRFEGDRLTLSGGKEWITNACTGDYALVLARHKPARHFTSFAWVLVPLAEVGVSSTPVGAALFDGAGLGHLSFDEIVLDRRYVIGSPSRGMASFARHVTSERLAGGFWARAMSRRILADTHRWLSTRQFDGGTLADNAAIRDRFARCVVEWRRLDALCRCAVDDMSGSDRAVSGMVLKVAVAQSLDLILGECVQLRGADAFGECGLAQARAEMAMFGIAGGASGAMLAGIADHAVELLKEPA